MSDTVPIIPDAALAWPEVQAMRDAHVPSEDIADIIRRHPRCTRPYDVAVYDALIRVGASYPARLKTTPPDR